MERIDALIAVCKTNWLILAYLAFVGVTLMGVTDLDFFLPERQTQLPLVNVTVPTQLFFAIAPGLGVLLYAHLHFYLIRLWDALANPKAPPAEKLSPWLVTDFALSPRDGQVRAFPLQWGANLAVFIMIFLATPGVLLGFWWWSMPKHDPWLTLLWTGGALFLSVMVGVRSYWHLRVLSAPRSRSVRWAGWVAVFVLLFGTGWVRAVNTLAYYAEYEHGLPFLFGGRSYFAWQQSRLRDAAQKMKPDELKARFGEYAEAHDLRYLVVRDLQRRWWMRTIWPDLLSKAQLRGAELVTLPDDWQTWEQAETDFRKAWCDGKGMTSLICGLGPYATEPDAPYMTYQRHQWCLKTFKPPVEMLVCDSFFQAQESRYQPAWRASRRQIVNDLAPRDLSGVDLRGAVLLGARLEGADLLGARLDGADLLGARLEGADLRGARLEGADLLEARLEGAVLLEARLEGADLRGARLEGADLLEARLEGAVLLEARLEGADLLEARLEGAVLLGARLEGADLRGARLEEADLLEARLEGADLRGTAFRNADLTTVIDLTADQVKSAFGDASVILPDELKPAPAHWPDWELDFVTFYEEWRRWRADPDTYIPPPKPADK